jgi:glycosyltransferase involved in cell wall biosynthesis
MSTDSLTLMTDRPVMLLVLGMHRSGTSLAARAMECLGAIPSQRQLGPLPNNPTGFFEDIDVLEFNEKVLMPALGIKWHEITSPNWSVLEGERFRILRLWAHQIVSRNFSQGHRLYVLKEPRLSVLLPFWLDIFAHAGYDVRAVHVVRDPLSVARSLQLRDEFPIKYGSLLYAAHWIDTLCDSYRLPGTFISYDDLIDNTDRILRKVADNLNILLPADFSDRVLDFVSLHMDPDLRHERHYLHEILQTEPDIQGPAISVYRVLSDAVNGSMDVTSVRHSVIGLKKEVLHDASTEPELERLHHELQIAQESLKHLITEINDLKEKKISIEHDRQTLEQRLEETQQHRWAAESLGSQLRTRLSAIESSLTWRLATFPHAFMGAWRDSRWSPQKAVRDLWRCQLFDLHFYCAVYPDVLNSGLHPLRHYLMHGGVQGRRPSPVFNAMFYLENDPALRIGAYNPLVHYIRHGRAEGRLILPPQRQVNGETPLAREIRNLAESGLMDSEWYLKTYPDVLHSGMNPSEHYVIHGWKEDRDPSAWFSTRYYVMNHLGGRRDGTNPLLHYLETGYASGFLPSADHLDKSRGWKRSSVPSLLCAVSSQSVDADSLNPPPKRSQVPDRTHTAREWLPGAGTILFIGCDALVAGSQVLLLNLLQWLHAHTSITIKVVLPSGGPLLDEYAKCGDVIVWQQFKQAHPDTDHRRTLLNKRLGKVNLIYGNTIVASSLYEEFSFLNAPVISHIHELEKTIRFYGDSNSIKAMERMTDVFIGCSPPVSANLLSNHQSDPDRIATIHAFIAQRPPLQRERPDIRHTLGLPPSKFIVVGCGTIYWRKGVDLFVETAISLLKENPERFHFIWIGEHYWDADKQSRSMMPWQAIQDRISEHRFESLIQFVGFKPNAREYFQAADLFYLSSREDPFPLVCLEAAQVGTPIVCFDDAGGIPEFVGTDAGTVVPYENAAAAADAILTLVHNDSLRLEKGSAANAKVRRLHTDDVAVPQILNLCRQVMNRDPVVSVIVPLYNHQKFVIERVESILGQSFRDMEVILLDDASSDDTPVLASSYENHPQVRVVASKSNSGSAFRQWRKGLAMARGEFIWIAEGDDSSSSDFLRELLPFFNDPEVVLAYADSVQIDGDGKDLGDYREYYASLDPSHWKMDYVVPGETEISMGLGAKNTIPNISATIFRRKAVALETLDSIEPLRFSGDWMFYVQLIKDRKIAYRNKRLNRHRKHVSTLTHQYNQSEEGAAVLLDEARLIHEWVLANYQPGPGLQRRLQGYLHAQIEALHGPLAPHDQERFYPVQKITQAAAWAVTRSSACAARIAFITSGDSAHDGGSEQLWIQTAIQMANGGDEVLVVIKRWTPEPYFFESFRNSGVRIVYKDENPESALVQFSPSLVAINIGDQDEGTSWYSLCRTQGFPFAIINHLTKEPRYWPIRHDLNDEVRKGYLAATQVFFTSRNNRQLMERRLGIAIRQADLFHNPLYLDRNRTLSFPDTSGPLRLAMPARMLNIHKGQQIALEVFSRPKWRERNLELHLYGNGPDEEAFKRFAEEHRLTQVFFHDPSWQLPKPDLEGIWRHCHGLLMTSFMEGMPIVLLNAMSCGRVPIVTDIGGHSEVIEDGVSGFLADEPSADAVDAALERAWALRHQWSDIGLRARESMLAFSPEDPVGEMAHKLRALIQVKPKAEVTED